MRSRKWTQTVPSTTLTRTPIPKITQTHETITKWNIIYLYNTRHMNLGMWFKEIHHELQTSMDLT